MSVQVIQIRIKINFTVILLTVLLIHLFLLLSRGVPLLGFDFFLPQRPSPSPSTLKIRRVKTKKVDFANLKTNESIIDASSPKSRDKGVSLKDLALERELKFPKPQNQDKTLSHSHQNNSFSPASTQTARPGTRPEYKSPRSIRRMNTMGLKTGELKNISPTLNSKGQSFSKMITGTQKVNDAVVSIEVPDGVEVDQLNDYELMFYGFQKRVAINYINSILKNLQKFEKSYPNYRLPSEEKVTMTARITYDKEGHVVQIKMMRWTKINEIQNLFENIVKEIDQLHNPPKALWEKSNQFSMYYTLEIVNG